MRILLVGGGGREHAIGWKLHQSSRLDRLMSLPGNPGLAELGSVIEGIDPNNVGGVATMAGQLGVDLVVVGPEAPLAAGLVDAFGRDKIPVWGPNRAAARLESSKQFAKAVMDRAGVATAPWEAFTDEAPALAYLKTSEPPYVVKADGLASGKGVLVTADITAAEDWVRRCMGGEFGPSGTTVVIEGFLEGPEVSVFALCSGTDVVALEPARDYKRLRTGDEGPNTGGMGAYSPVTDLPPGLIDHVITKVMKPVLVTMAAEGSPYRGFLYAGLVLTSGGPHVLEFNCRLGDPETQVVLPRMKADLVDLIEAGVTGSLGRVGCDWSTSAAVNVVLAAPGYPDQRQSGQPVHLPPLEEGELIFHAGTTLEGKRLLTSGGRVLNAVGVGADRDEARRRAYRLADRIRFSGKQYRTDIASDQSGAPDRRGTEHLV
jgi:phosphoribosylamine--glycine ligase